MSIDEVEWAALLKTPGSCKKAGKFDVLPKAPPWTMDQDSNLRITAEWIYRAGKRGGVRLRGEGILTPLREGWLRDETDNGLFIHTCYPDKLLSFRRQYEALHHNIEYMTLMGSSGEDSFGRLHSVCDQARTTLWSAWNCMGRDGATLTPERWVDEAFPPPNTVAQKTRNSLYDNTTGLTREYHYQCNRCCGPLPKAIQAWVRMQKLTLAMDGSSKVEVF